MIRVRLARSEDVPFVRALAEVSIVYGIPPTRSIEPQKVQENVRRAYADLESTFDAPDMPILVAEDLSAPEEKVLRGYIMLDFTSVEPATGEHQCFITDLAVDRSAWGRGTTHQLIEEAARLTAARGLKYLVGHVSVNNQRTLEIAQGALDFQIERHQIVKICKP